MHLMLTFFQMNNTAGGSPHLITKVVTGWIELWMYCRSSRTGDALRVGGVRGCQAEEFALAAQGWYRREAEGPEQQR